MPYALTRIIERYLRQNIKVFSEKSFDVTPPVSIMRINEQGITVKYNNTENNWH